MEPVFKNGGRFDISNFRLISVFTSYSKVFENVIYGGLYERISQNNIGVGVSNNLTENASYKLINDILLALNNKLTIGGILCDLEKAFDCVNHNIFFLSKLEFCEMVG